MCPTPRRNQANEAKSGMEAEWVRAFAALHSLQSKKKLLAVNRWETHFFSNNKKDKWIKDYLHWKTAVGTKQVDDAETEIKHEQEDMRNTAQAGLTTTKPQETFQERLCAIRDSLSDFPCSDDLEDGEDKDDDEQDPELGKLGEDDKPGWVMDTIPNTVQYNLESFRQQQMKFHELTQPGWGDAADYFHPRNQQCGLTELKILAVV